MGPGPCFREGRDKWGRYAAHAWLAFRPIALLRDGGCQGIPSNLWVCSESRHCG
jgi:hypothetical protein